MRTVLLLLGLIMLSLTPVWAQGKAKEYVVTTDRAIIVTREVLVKQGFEVVRVEETPVSRVIWYRRGNNGKGKGKGRPEKLVIRRVADRVVFEETPSAFLVDIDVRLRLP
jgi:hypothetical protein